MVEHRLGDVDTDGEQHQYRKKADALHNDSALVPHHCAHYQEQAYDGVHTAANWHFYGCRRIHIANVLLFYQLIVANCNAFVLSFAAVAEWLVRYRLELIALLSISLQRFFQCVPLPWRRFDVVVEEDYRTVAHVVCHILPASLRRHPRVVILGE